MAIEFAISDWSGWTLPSVAALSPASPVRVGESPDVSSIPPLLRRRLNTLGRASAAEILRHIHKGDNFPVVYCSRHGDIERTLNILTELVSDDPVSPMNFSLSVHNAITGIISIHQGISANICSIASLDEGLVPVLLEAAGMLDDEQNRVLCVFSDVRLPEIYRQYCTWPEAPFAACFSINAHDGMRVRLDMEYGQSGSDSACHQSQLSEPLRFVEFLASEQQSLTTPHNGSRWTICKC